MNLIELDHALRKLRLSGMATVLATRLHHAQADHLAPIDLISALVTDELQRRQDRLLERRRKQARFRDPDRSLDTFDFAFNKKMNRALIFELATGRFIAQHEDVLFLGPPGTGKSHLAKRSATRRFSRAIASCTGKRTRCSRNSPTPRSPAHEKPTSPTSEPSRSSSSMISGCANCPTPPARICWNS